MLANDPAKRLTLEEVAKSNWVNETEEDDAIVKQYLSEIKKNI